MLLSAKGPLLEEYTRALKAGKKAGVKRVRVDFPSGHAFTFLLDDDAEENLAKQLRVRPIARWQGNTK
jgi:hypothetical protein